LTTNKLYSGNPRSLAFILTASLSAFGLYTCIFALRKAFGVGTYADLSWLGVGFKSWMVIFQVIGYLVSKFTGIKLVSEMKSENRARNITLMVIIASASWLGFALSPVPFNFLFIFINGFILGFGWGLVFSYMEGRSTTEVLGAAVSVSFIFSAGFSKSVAGWLLKTGITEIWMPFATAVVFIGPLLIFLKLLDKIPAPSPEDEALRTRRVPMTGQERIAYVKEFFPGLALLVLSYILLTAFRDFRDNFSAEIWIALGYGGKPGIFTLTETVISITVLVLIASLMFIRNNYRAMVINHLIVIAGMLMVGISTWLFRTGLLSPTAWMILVGMGLYFGYIQFNSIFFDRILATFKTAATVGFLIYLADAFGYIGSVSVILYKELGNARLSWLEFFVRSAYTLSILGTVFMVLALRYFVRKRQVSQ
jgi:MFS family permease